MANPFADAFVRIRPDTTLFRQETQAKVGTALSGAGFGGVGARALVAPTAIAGLLVFAAAARAAVGGAADLEQELNTFEVVADATAAQMEQVSEQAKALGADLTLPAVSAGDAAKAFTELARGGLEVKDVLGGAKGVLQLAAAAELDVAEAAQITARALTTFRLPGEQAAEVANLLVGASNAATGEVTDMALALQQAGLVSAQAGLSLEQTVGAITQLAKQGLVGSDAGTSLRTTLLKLVPTSKEAADVTDALGIKLDRSRTLGEQLPELIDQYKSALDRLNPTLRQQATETIFGTDAIRGFNALIADGSEGLAAITAEAAAAGQAEELAAAKAEGLSGAWAGLKSQGETLAASVGEILLPALTDLVEGLAGIVGAANDATNALKDIELPDLDLPDTPFGIGLGDLFPTPNEVTRKVQEVLDPFVNTIKDEVEKNPLRISFSAVDALTGGIQDDVTRELGPSGALAEKLRIQASATGRGTGKALGDGIADGIISAEQEAVSAARSTLAEVLRAGKDAVAEAISQGAEAVRLSAIDARSNLISIGQSLATDALALLEEGPLARRIEQLRASLDRSQAGNERRRLQQGLSDAERALKNAQRQAETAGPLTPQQQRARGRFLEPFQRDIADAKAALGEFNTESVIGNLEKQAAAQKETVQKGIADLIVQFNQGGISLSNLNVRIAGLLAKNGIEPYGEAGRRLGLAARTSFIEEFKGLLDQAREIALGIDVPQIGLEPTIVSPTGTRAEQDKQIRQAREDAADRERAARDAVIRAQNALKRSLEDDTDATKDLAAAIRAAFKVAAPKKTSTAAGPGSSGDRSSGRTP